MGKGEAEKTDSPGFGFEEQFQISEIRFITHFFRGRRPVSIMAAISAHVMEPDQRHPDETGGTAKPV